MNYIKDILKILALYVVVSIVVLNIFLKSQNLTINIVGAILTVVIETVALIKICEVIKHLPPSSREKREEIVLTFSQRYSLDYSYMNIREIVEASFCSIEWEHELIAMTYKYEHIGQYYKGETSWLRVYLAAFPARYKEITNDINDQKYIVVEKYYKNMVDEINRKGFETNSEIIDYLFKNHCIDFDSTSFSIWKLFMRKQNYDIKLKNDGQIGIDSEYYRLVKKYNEK